MKDAAFKHTHLWNDLPYDERHRLMPYQIETHILHLLQTKTTITRDHRRTIAKINDHINNLRSSLAELERENDQ